MIVVKYGGHAMDGAATFAEDVELVRRGGERVVVVHGGGPRITAALERRGVDSVFAGGRRVTTPEAMDVVREVLVGEVNAEVVAALAPHGAGVCDVLTAVPLDPALGLVGDVTRVDTDPLTALLDAGRVPVVATVASGTDGTPYNVNADTAAAAIAVALGAASVTFLTDVAGLYADRDDPATLVSEIAADALAGLLPSVGGGMAPKMQACLRAVRGGVAVARVVDGRVPHALLRDDLGTRVTPC